ncbi:MAG: amidohydrolase [Chitinophagaceae bacterium]|nr:MAG: amidohydrolase [Chitinophagaceae bacterium]
MWLNWALTDSGLPGKPLPITKTDKHTALPYSIIDSHQHFWKYDPVRDRWIGDGMDVLKKDFLPVDLLPELDNNGVDGCVAVQASESDQETSFLLELAGRNTFIKGVVGWIDLESPTLEQQLHSYQQYPLLKGFRPMLQSDPQRDKMLQPAFLNGVRLLQEYGFTLDLIILPDQLDYCAELALMFPRMKLVIDHLGKPPVRSGNLDAWTKSIRRYRDLQNVYCKVSGLVTEADWLHWTKPQLMPAIDQVVETFGTSRIMFGSDWPVCLLAAGYTEVMDILDGYFSPADQQQFYAGNACAFYSIT